MPFVSDKQRKFLYSQKPGVARKFAAHEGDEGPERHGMHARLSNLKSFIGEMRGHEKAGHGHEEFELPTKSLEQADERFEQHKLDPPDEEQHEQELAPKEEGENVEFHYDGPGGKPSPEPLMRTSVPKTHGSGEQVAETDHDLGAAHDRFTAERGTKHDGTGGASHGAPQQLGHQHPPRHEAGSGDPMPGSHGEAVADDEDLEAKHIKWLEARKGERHD